MFGVLITIVHVVACVFLILVVLLQTGKGAEMGAVFGGSSSTVFGSSGAGNFLTRLTTATAIIFMLTSLSLTYLSTQQTTATIFDAAPLAQPAAPASEPQQVAPAVPVAPVAPAPAAAPEPAPAAP
jgi:preprotein translocase subunit SecG